MFGVHRFNFYFYFSLFYFTVDAFYVSKTGVSLFGVFVCLFLLLDFE